MSVGATGSVEESSADDLHGVVEARLRRVDQRYTPGRRAIVELLVSSGRPVSIGDIADYLPDLPRSSAYRHLVDLEVAGLVRRVAAGDEFARFELAEDLTEHHHHLVCLECGNVIDVTPSEEFESGLGHTVNQLASAEGFEPQSHRLDVLGVCSECREPGASFSGQRSRRLAPGT
jgi:Fur family transcriptional regulator, ferric uptake regulator